MNEIEERLGRALDAAAATVRPEDLRPLSTPEAAPSRRRTARTWAPVAAVLMVAMVVAGAVLVTGRRGEAPDTRPVSAATRYLLALPPSEGPNVHDRARIIDPSTGRSLQEVSTPRGVGRWSAAAGTAGNRTFFLLGTPEDGADGPDRLYRLRVDDRGRTVALDPLPGGDLPGGSVGRLTASADGGTLAFTVDAGKGPDRPGVALTVQKVASGHRRAWDLTGYAEYLSLSADGRRLALAWFSSPRGDGVRVLDTGTLPGDTASWGRPAVPVPGPLDEVRNLWLRSDGRSLLVESARASRARLVEVSPATGAVTGTVLERAAFTLSCRSADGRHLLLGTGTALEWLDLRSGRAVAVHDTGNVLNREIVC
ncbi:hypothetical protein [Actinomadura chibensis]|uniref:WD40 repeat domain-containing protein n=1 Tax=Actinomadura chibensis TaxID=392828 RepID=A0A5D0N9P1_9ACTN|nr:hypothetical protein [Actinomadura chibensis]TYB41160.1 hypothetical protein FXF69_37260 [Actinomadura chibensis]